MVLLVRLSQISLLIAIYESAVADDFLPGSGIEYSQFLPPEIDGEGTELALGLDPASIPSDSLDSDLFVQTDPAGSLPSNGENSALDFFSTSDPSDQLFTDDASSIDLIAGSNVGCVSYEGQAISRTRRDNLCVDDSLLKEPPTAGSDLTFPPLGSNQNRLPGEINDPKPRPVTDIPNSEEDHELCPTGQNGYREYAVCDSGREEDRWQYFVYEWALWHCSHRRHTSRFFLLRHDRLKLADSVESIFWMFSSSQKMVLYVLYGL